jgi:hypothetical protein
VLQLVGTEEVGPQVGGQYSRRRDKANHRMDVAAQLRKAKSEPKAAEPAPAQAAAPAPATRRTRPASRT